VSTAVISDIHGNAVALQTVLADIDRRGVDRIICLGDIVGYGPQPLRCVDLVAQRCEWSLIGNHDFAVLYEPTNFNAGAEQAAFWTRDQFDAEPDETIRAKRYDFLGQLRVRVVESIPGDTIPILAVHGSPRRPINEYLFPDDVLNAVDKMKQVFDMIERVGIVCRLDKPKPGFAPSAGRLRSVDREPTKPRLEESRIAQVMNVPDQCHGDVLKQIIQLRIGGFVRKEDGRRPSAVLFPQTLERLRVA